MLINTHSKKAPFLLLKNFLITQQDVQDVFQLTQRKKIHLYHSGPGEHLLKQLKFSAESDSVYDRNPKTIRRPFQRTR
ncbi:MAG: hypothetical protein KatS3mg028_1309 [Bacteroidia bacterium]|nr:MAG: hypothetical protein KatS3mg028_1309 [Bacteroidia bacterium]